MNIIITRFIVNQDVLLFVNSHTGNFIMVSPDDNVCVVISPSRQQIVDLSPEQSSDVCMSVSRKLRRVT